MWSGLSLVKVRTAIQLLLLAKSDPVALIYHLRSRYAHTGLIDRYRRLCKKTGLLQPAFILSFDCDTEKDIQVAGDVHQRLGNIGIKPVYAVPGALLERGADVYRAIADTGSEFINHGYAEHCHYDDGLGVYESSFFYDQLPREIVRQDILRGDAALRTVLGVQPRGFRTPHFGTFQTRAELNFLYEILTELDYEFSSSTTPYVGLRWGPVLQRSGLIEIPVTGCPDDPIQILDSWSFRFNPGRRHQEDYYVRQMVKTAESLRTGAPYFVNIYADPSQVYDWEDFFSAMEELAPYCVPSYSHLLQELQQ